MSHWTRAQVDVKCGRCRDHIIPKGSPMKLIQVAGVKRPLVRCEDCEGPAPKDLEALPDPPARAIPLGFSRFQVPADYSARRTGEKD